MVVVAVGDVGLLEKGAEGRLREEKPKLTLSTLPRPAAALLPRLSGTWCGPGPGPSGRNKLKQRVCHKPLSTARGGTVDFRAHLVGGEDLPNTACYLDTRCLHFTYTCVIT